MRRKRSSKVKRVCKYIRRSILVILAYVLVGALVPYMYHPKADSQAAAEAVVYQGESGSDERVLCIDDNMDALIWRLRVIEAAKEEIVISTLSCAM